MTETAEHIHTWELPVVTEDHPYLGTIGLRLDPEDTNCRVCPCGEVGYLV